VTQAKNPASWDQAPLGIVGQCFTAEGRVYIPDRINPPLHRFSRAMMLPPSTPRCLRVVDFGVTQLDPQKVLRSSAREAVPDPPASQLGKDQIQASFAIKSWQ
jgi:hypothetical protein